MGNLIVGVGDMAVSKNPNDHIVTHALGSCIGLTDYDPVAQVGGMLHYMLPDSTIDNEKAASRPCMFADTGIALLFRELGRLGANRKRFIVKAAGGSQIMDAKGIFNVGRRNALALRKTLWKTAVMIDAEDVGGTKPRTMKLEIATGSVLISSGGKKATL